MPIVRKLRSRGLADGRDFGFRFVDASGWEFWVKDPNDLEYLAKHQTFLTMQG